MLEANGLRLRPWAAPAESREILDAAGVPLGCAARRPGSRWRTHHLAVYETEDASLVCTARRRRLSRRWDVADAEGRPVGGFRPMPARGGVLVNDWFGLPVARVEAPGAAGRIVAPDGTELATLHHTPDGTTLRYTAAGKDNPFTRMLLLTAVLAAGW